MPVTTPAERLSRPQLAAHQWELFQRMLAEILPRNPFWTQRFAASEVHVSQIQSLADLPRLPLTTKADLVADQQSHPPYGTNLTYPQERYFRLHQTSGTTGRPMRWLDTPASWQGMLDAWKQIYRMIGLTAEDRLCFPFSFGPFLGFWAGFEGATQLGNLTLAAGGMSSQGRLALIIDNEVTFVCCTPTYALRLTEVAAECGIDLASSAVRGLVVAGEPGGCMPAVRSRLEAAWGARVFDHWGMTEAGPLATECAEDPGSLYMLETMCIAEIIDPVTTEPVAPGGEGELVVTNLNRWGSPLIRYRTGDIVKGESGGGPGGYDLLRLAGGILGRADDMLTIRGNNFYPSVLEELIRQVAGVVEFRIEVRIQKGMQHVLIEIEPTPTIDAEQQTPQLLRTIGQLVKDRLNFQADIRSSPPGSLPRFEMKGQRFHRVIEE